ncbi:MAG: hypothetical protein GSR85_07400 [Desulfurococcales archaeon]|nr:hypothetical protein [Desulfurococcales archaeon]
MALGDKPYRVSEFVDILGERRKAILDALRKLELKGLITKGKCSEKETCYSLSENGKRFSDGLRKLINLDKHVYESTLKGDMKKLSINIRIALQRRLVEVSYAYKALMALYYAPNNILSVDQLSRFLNLSSDRVKSYLDLFSMPPYRLFRRVLKPNGTVYYLLDEEGKRIASKIPEITRLKSSRLLLAIARRLSMYDPHRAFIVMARTSLILSIVAGAPVLFLGESLVVKLSALVMVSLTVLGVVILDRYLKIF